MNLLIFALILNILPNCMRPHVFNLVHVNQNQTMSSNPTVAHSLNFGDVILEYNNIFGLLD